MTTQGILAACGFEKNPFRIVPPADMENVVWAGDQSLVDHIIAIADSPKPEHLETSEFITLMGEYGAGKTNALKFIHKKLRDDNQLGAYVLRPFLEGENTGWEDIVRYIFSSQLQKDEVIERFKPLRRYVLTQANERATEEIGTADPDSLLNLTVQKKEEVISEIFSDRPGFVDFIMDLCGTEESTRDQNWEYMTVKLPAAQASRIGTKYGLPPEGMNNAHSAGQLFTDFVTLLTYKTELGDVASEMFFLLIDEMDDVRNIKLANRTAILTGLRDLVNFCGEHSFLALAATLSDSSDFYGILDQPLMNRLTREVITIPQFEADKAKEFVLDLMAHYRLSDYDGENTWPFSEDGLDAFIAGQEAQGPITARRLQRSAARLILDKNKEKIIGGMEVDASDISEFIDWG